MKVTNMTSSNGNKVANQFLITCEENGQLVDYFQSYDTVIAKYLYGDHPPLLSLDKDAWDYSRTTSKYRNQFTGLTTAQTKAGIKDGSIKLVDLNGGA